MLVTNEPVLRNFWYAVMPMSEFKETPKPFRLLGEKLVLWVDHEGKPAALQDRCCHRSAALSCGSVQNGCVVCPYHAWEFNSSGQCVHMPQLKDRAVPKNYAVRSYLCTERYGYVWVCLGTPMRDIPEFPEASNPNFRQIHCFYETWNTSSPRVVENELDMGHFAVVHRETIGNRHVALPLSYELTDLGPDSLNLQAQISVKTEGQQKKNTHSNSEIGFREMSVTWYAPFLMRLDLKYPSGLRHVIINHPTPIDDNHIQVVQFHFRDDTEQDISTDELLSFERLIVNEDKYALESTDPDFPLDSSTEVHMSTDRAGLLFRSKLKKLLSHAT